MKIAAVLTSLVASASAFAPSKQAGSSNTALFAKDFSQELGAMAPLGLFDPCNVLEEADDEFFNTLRTIELKHGRMAMLAVPGYLVTYAGMRLPGLEGVPSGMDAWSNLPATVLYQMGATLMLMEIVNSDIAGKSEFPGDYRNGALDFGWDKLDDATKMKKRSIELNNGRAAQMGILGLITHEYMGNIGDILP